MKILFCTSAVFIAFWIFQMIFPYRPPQNLDISIIEQNKKKYNRLEKWAIFWIFLSVGLICLCVFVIGFQIRNNFLSSEYEYIIVPTNSFWVFPGIVLGFGLIRIPMEFTYKMILKGEYYLYTQYTNLKHGFDGEKIWKPIEYILTLSGVVIFILGLNWFVRIDKNDKIEINELFSLKTHTYNLSDISEIGYRDKYITKKGTEKDIKHYVIKMTDGYEWSSYVYGFFSVKKDDDKLEENIDRISKMTGIIIENSPNR
jgi:hypothetical protein